MKIINKIKPYLSEIFVTLGVGIFSYYVYLGPTITGSRYSTMHGGGGGVVNYHNNIKVFAILLITIGILMIVRKYFTKHK